MSISRKKSIILLWSIIIALALLISSAFLMLIRFNLKQSPRVDVVEIKNEVIDAIEVVDSKEYIYFSRLTGQGVENELEQWPKVIAVMVNNNPDGFPLVGINEASIVYEVPVEGVYTRLMAIYPENANVDQIGPVRSARTYYLDWLGEYGTTLYMHCGGSFDALKEIKKRSIFDADEFSKTSYYWRDKTRLAPHNLFTASTKWQEYIEIYSTKYDFPEWDGWSYGDLNSGNEEGLQGVSFAYGKNYVVGWRYNEDINMYERILNDQLFLDKNGQNILTDNIIFQFASMKVVDNLGRRDINTIGEGEMRLFRDGVMIRGIWKKNSLSERTRFYNEGNEEINLKPGKTWLMVVPKNASLIVAN